MGWSFQLQRSSDAGITWSTFKTSPIQKASAYEDTPVPYGSSTKAKFTTMSLNVDSSKSSHYSWRAVVKATWFKKTGAVLGTNKHEVHYYRVKTGSTSFTDESFCYGSGSL